MLATEVILYMQVDLVKRHCFPVYWNAENRRVMRGHWFARKGGLDWLPLREDVAEQLEIAYRSRVRFCFSNRLFSCIFIQSLNCLKILFAKHLEVFMMKKMFPCDNVFSYCCVVSSLSSFINFQFFKISQ